MKRLFIAAAIFLVAITADWFIWQSLQPKPVCSPVMSVPAHATPAEIKQIAKMARQWCLDNGYSVNK